MNGSPDGTVQVKPIKSSDSIPDLDTSDDDAISPADHPNIAGNAQTL